MTNSMSQPSLASRFTGSFEKLSPRSDEYVPDIVRLILSEARAGRASDVHLVPGEAVLMMHWRIDGVLHPIAGFDREIASRVVARLKVICGLLTYRTDIPQEGRVAREHSTTEVRVTTFPTLHGEKAAIRLFAENDQLQRLDQLGLPSHVLGTLRRHLEATAGVILLTGPSGSGKTTTAYACLRDIIQDSAGSRCIMTLEDPIEVAVDGATQSQVRPAAGFDLATGLRSLMRQDPDVILVGEIRDPETAEAAFQAALTGHLVLTTFHAGSSAEAITRLLDMHIEPYLIRSGLRTVICQRLLRRACSDCSGRAHSATIKSSEEQKLRTEADKKLVETAHPACDVCGSTGYLGRLVLAEMLDPDQPEVSGAILQRSDARQLASLAEMAGMETLHQAAVNAVTLGLTTHEEVLRVLGGTLKRN
jgi:type II secretory ATPase GspE/PulE/Tfp pilus assembly ATPase PilB-like protein